MNYKALVSALVLSLLLLIPAGLISVPRGNSTEFVVPSLYINPPDTKFYGPCLVSTTFPIDVFLWNNPLSGEDVYAFNFTVDWSNIPTISLVSATAHSPWANFFTISNTNLTENPATGLPTDWNLAMTAIPPSTGLLDVNQSVLTLVFHIDTDVCYPNNVIGNFTLTLGNMSGDGTVPIPITNAEIDGGTFEQYSVIPDIELTSTAANATGWIIEKCISHTFDVEVDLTNVTDVYGFSFVMTYDPLHLETDPQQITFKAAFPPPYETLSVTFPSAGVIDISLVRPSEKPTVCGADIPAVDIVFHTIDAVTIAVINPVTGVDYAENAGGLIPTPSISAITLTSAAVFYKCPTGMEYDFPGTLVFGGPLTYYFKPSRCDLNLDCVVDVQDLQVLLPYYGLSTAAAGTLGYGDLSSIGAPIVSIFDFVQCAKMFGPVDP